MFSMKIAAMVLSLCVIFATHTHAEIAAQQQHQNWISGIVYPNGETRFRALTTYRENGDYVVLAFDRGHQSCTTQYVSMNIVLPEISQYTYESQPAFGAIRIDEMAIHNVNFTLSVQSGYQIATVTLTNFENEGSIIDELRRGNDLRIKLATGKKDFYLRFSLRGYTAALSKTLQSCIQSAQNSPSINNADKNYFSDTFKVKDDRNYFRY